MREERRERERRDEIHSFVFFLPSSSAICHIYFFLSRSCVNEKSQHATFSVKNRSIISQERESERENTKHTFKARVNYHYYSMRLGIRSTSIFETCFNLTRHVSGRENSTWNMRSNVIRKRRERSLLLYIWLNLKIRCQKSKGTQWVNRNKRNSFNLLFVSWPIDALLCFLTTVICARESQQRS
jgi:hypothetical protein